MLSRYLRFSIHRWTTPALVAVCAVVAVTMSLSTCSAADEIALGSLTYDSLIDLIMAESSGATAARQDYELSLLRHENSTKLWDPQASVSGTLEDYDVIKDSHARSVALSLKNQTQTLGGAITLEAGSVYYPGPQRPNLRNQVSVTFDRSLTTGGIEASLVELKATLAELQAEKTYSDQVSDLITKGITCLSAAVKERNDLIVAAVRLELAAFNKTVADEKYSRGIISASALAAAQDGVRDASKSYFDKLTGYRDKLWELSRNTGLADIADHGLEGDVSRARLAVSEFLEAAWLEEESPASARELLATLRDLVLLPKATVKEVDSIYERLSSEPLGEDEIKRLPAMRISDLSLEIERLTLEKNERDLGWQLNASVEASWADFKRLSSGDVEPTPNFAASAMVTFNKQLLGSSMAESSMELQVKRSRLEDEARTALPAFTRQLSNLEKTVEDKEYAQEAADQSLGESLELWELTVSNYAAGMAANADVVSAGVSLLQAESALRSSQIDTIVAKLRYINAVGQPPATGWMEAE